MDITIEQIPTERREECPEIPEFGAVFTDHMFIQEFDQGQGWHSASILPFQQLRLHPAAAVLHYGQEIFEGLKAYRRDDGGINLFRVDQNLARFNRSAARMVMPTVDELFHLKALKALISADQRWVPAEPGSSLYLRPAMIAITPKLGLGAATSYLHFILASPVGAYFKTGIEPISVFVSDTSRRAVKGGVGEAKTGGNYAASLYAAERVAAEGFHQVLWLDAIAGRFIEEVGSMNICFVYKDGTIKTPLLSGSILAGITRDSILKLAPTLGHDMIESRLDIEDVLGQIADGEITEVFGCGTAAVISPVGRIAYRGKDYLINKNIAGPIAKKLHQALTAIQYSKVEDPFGWVHHVS